MKLIFKHVGSIRPIKSKLFSDEICFCHELSKRGLSYQRQIDVPIIYDNIVFDEGLRLDVFVEKEIICELKARETINPVWPAQVLSHLKLIVT